MNKKIKFVLLTVLILLVLKSNGQNSNLYPCADNIINDRIKQYDESLKKIFLNNLKKDYIVRFIAIPSFNPEYLYQINKLDQDNFEITVLMLKENLWNIKNYDSIQFSLISKKIDRDIVFSLDTLFKILTDSVSGSDVIGYGEDGVSYYFKRNSKDGVKCGETWSPDENSILNDIIQICENLILYVQGKNTDLNLLQERISFICKRLGKYNSRKQ